MTVPSASAPPRRSRLAIALASAMAATTLALPPLVVHAQSPAPAPQAAAPVPEHAHGRGGHHGGRDTAREARRQAYESLTTPEERTAFREKMRAAAPEERRTLAQAHRGEIEQRARDRGITLPPATGPHAHGSGAHAGKQDAAREARRQAYESLTTPEERTAFREKMRAAAPEERRALAQAHRGEIEQRARDRGITLPPAPERHRHPERSPGPRMAPPAS